MSIREQLADISRRIVRAAETAGVEPDSIHLVGASKMNDASRVREAIGAGLKICGENRVQEMLEKNAQGAYEGAELHFIGHLQKNKVKNVVGLATLIHSVDSVALMEQIEKCAAKQGIVQDILLEINIGREANKSGVLPEAAEELAASAADLEGLCLKGIMSIPPRMENKGQIYNYFDELCKIYVDIGAKKYDNTDMCVLSMGMTADFEAAILAGATMVRIGSALFGARPKNTPAK